MKTTCLPAERLDGDLIAQWNKVRAGDPRLDSGLFCPDLVREVAEVRDGIEVAVIEQDGRNVGFFPYRRDRDDVAMPFAGPLSDLQGMIMGPGTRVDVKRMLRDCGLVAWSFDNLLASQDSFAPFHVVRSESSFIDVSAGFEAYRRERRRAGGDELRETMRKGRKIERERGPVRFVPQETDSRVLSTLLNWKREQLKRVGARDSLGQPWIEALLRRLISNRSDSFAGMLSAVYVGDDLAAATMGVRSRHVLHGWITAFDRRFHKYSPGLILLVELAKAAESLDIRRIDMGKGTESYKKSFRTGTIALAEGVVDLRVMAGMLKQNWLRAREWVKGTPLADPARKLVHRVRPERHS